MKTPICDFIKEYSENSNARFHMPGHKGKSFLGAEKLDITEIDGADVLYNGNGIIRESEKNTATLFGTEKTLYSTEGSSLSIRAMLYLAGIYAKSNGKALKIAAGRNAHKAFMTACALLDIEVDWLFPEKSESVVSCKITPNQLKKHLSTAPEKPVAVYVTSPDYLGNITDIKGLAKVCREYDVLLLVDNAHGAYLNFLPESLHPIALGADMSCDSAHKTLPVLTGGGYLHISPTAPSMLSEKAEDAMSLFASTSPSYLILQSLDMTNNYISNGYKERLTEFIKVAEKLKIALTEKGFTLIGDEALKITVYAKPYGYTGDEIANILKSSGIICEFYDPDYICFMLTPENSQAELTLLRNVFLELPQKEPLKEKAPLINRPERACSIREAMLSDCIELPVDECECKALANATLSCPPAIPIIICGETIDKSAIECMKYYGIKKCKVIK